MRFDVYASAHELQSVLGSGEADEPTVGAIILADFIDDVRQIRRLLEAGLGVKKHERKG